MSEAMTNPEIEDVLASIRRLVAQDRRPRPERLILTEEFRVRQANIPAPPILAQAPDGAPRPPLVEVVAEVVRAARAEPQAEAAAPAPAAAEAVPAAPAPAEISPAAPDPVAAPPMPPAAGAAAVDPEALDAALRALEAQLPPAAGPEPAARPAATGEAAAPPSARGEIVGEDVAFIDEDDLERIVARIVRDELRGQLGERITLMVRKLVRAEIARALDERNLLG